MFILTTVVAVLCSGLFAGPSWARLLTLYCWSLAFPAVMATLVIYGRGYTRTFAIGGLFGMAPMVVYNVLIGWTLGTAFTEGNWDSLIPDKEQTYAEGIMVGCYSGAVALLGLLVMGVRWMVESPQRTARKPHVAFDALDSTHLIPDFTMPAPTEESETAAG
jgi:hypothetical protein